MFSFPPPAAQRAESCPDLLSVHSKHKQAGRARAGRAGGTQAGLCVLCHRPQAHPGLAGAAQPQWELVWRAQPEGSASFGTNSTCP